MIDGEHDLPITKQADVLCISRGSVYYLPRPVPEADLAIMRRLDRLHLEFPFAGSRMLRGLLAADGCKIGRRHVKTLMKRMGLEALYRRPRTTKPEPGHKIYPYLLRGMEITRPNQVWAMDITYIPMARGFVYLAVVLDWFSRRVLSWRLSITMEAAFCVETLEDALARHGKPDIFNTDQGSQFTGSAFTGVLANKGIAISMDGKGAWRDNVFVERLWRSVKYEEVYLRAYDSVSEARASIGRYLGFYNGRRPHSSLDGSTPDKAYFNPLPLRMGSLTPADAPLIDAENLFRQPGPPHIAAMDLFVIPTIGFRLLYGFAIVRLDRRDLVWINVTTNPTAEWVARRITEAFPWDGAPRYMIRDRDRIFGIVVTRRLRTMGILDKPIAPASPWQNGIAERLIGSIRRECLDHVIVLGEAHLRRILNSYADYYNSVRTHRSLDKDAPVSRPVQRSGLISSDAILGGLHHHYVRV
jgi:putative transposase